MLEKTIEIFLEGKEIKECNKCLTPNMYLLELKFIQSKIENSIDIYDCHKCNKITPYEKWLKYIMKGQMKLTR